VVSVSLDELKAHLGITESDDDDELLGMLDAAVDVVENFVGPIDETAVTETHYSVNSGALVLNRYPATELVALSSVTGGSPIELVASDFVLDPATGVLRSIYGSGFNGTYTVTYSAGRPDTPAALRLAVLIVAAHLWETQRGPASTSGPLSADEDFTSVPGLGFAIPNRARELLQPYVQITVA
jgi:uncharacterized phiE125 gp8 family phage protein